MTLKRRIFWWRVSSYWWLLILLGILVLGYNFYSYARRYSERVLRLYYGKFQQPRFKIPKLSLNSITTTNVGITCDLTLPSSSITFFGNSETSDFFYNAYYRIEVFQSSTSRKVWSKEENLQKIRRFYRDDAIYNSYLSFTDYHSFNFKAPDEGYYDLVISTSFSGKGLKFNGCTVKVRSVPDDIGTPQGSILFILGILLLISAGILWLINFSTAPPKLY